MDTPDDGLKTPWDRFLFYLTLWRLSDHDTSDRDLLCDLYLAHQSLDWVDFTHKVNQIGFCGEEFWILHEALDPATREALQAWADGDLMRKSRERR